MERWRKIVIITLLLAFPISLWASASMASHCQMSDSTSHSSHTQVDDSDTMHSDDHESSEDSKNQSKCECNDSMGCYTSGCSATALINGITIDFNYSAKPVYQIIKTQAEPTDPDLLFRPPISFS